jgi:hypothetical protein
MLLLNIMLDVVEVVVYSGILIVAVAACVKLLSL